MRHYDQQLASVAKALEKGATRTGVVSAEWDVSARCERPIGRELVGRESPIPGAAYIGPAVGETPPGLYLDLLVPCRRCRACLARRRRHWADRAIAEVTQRGQRAWFGTLTARPEVHYQHLEIARKRAAARGVDLDAEKPERMFAVRVSILGLELTKYFKRLRKVTACDIKYMAVFERHESGNPHVHLILVEALGSDGIPKRMLEGQWHLGFSQWRLVWDVADAHRDKADAKRAVYYVTKLISNPVSPSRVRS